MQKNKYDYTTFEQVFEEIGYAFEAKYGCSLDYEEGLQVFNVYKLSIVSDGNMYYKEHKNTFDPKLWPRIHLLAKLLTKDPTFELLYVNE